MEVSQIELRKLYDLTFPADSPGHGGKTVRVIVDGMREGHWVAYLGKMGSVELRGSCTPDFFAEHAVPAN